MPKLHAPLPSRPVPADALASLAAQLRADESVVSAHVREPVEAPLIGEFVAAGPGAATDPAAYSLVAESVREGYLLHYGEPRLLAGVDADLRLLAGDYLYALGLERLAGLGDLEAVGQLSDLISLSAQLHAGAGGHPNGEATAAEHAPDERARAVATAGSLWIAVVTAIAAGSYERLEPAKTAVRGGEPGAGDALDRAADEIAADAGLAGRLAGLRAGIDSRAVRPN